MSLISWPLLGSVLLVVEIGLRLLALGVIPGGRKPQVGMAWLLLILIEPIIGFTIFLFFGHAHIGKRRDARQKAAFEVISDRTRLMTDYDAQAHSPLLGTVIELNHRLGALPYRSRTTSRSSRTTKGLSRQWQTKSPRRRSSCMWSSTSWPGTR